jgi:hypothetical protein
MRRAIAVTCLLTILYTSIASGQAKTQRLAGPAVLGGPARAGVTATMPPQTFFADTYTPPATGNATANCNTAQAVNFLVAGTVTAVQFWKLASDTGPHVGRVWRESDQAKLGEATFTGETASGWQTVLLTPPVPVAPGRYRISISHPTQPWANWVFTGLTIPGIMTLTTDLYYVLDQTSYPTSDGGQNSYAVDIVFAPSP